MLDSHLMTLFDVFAPFEDFSRVFVVPDIAFAIVDAEGNGFVARLTVNLELNTGPFARVLTCDCHQIRSNSIQ